MKFYPHFCSPRRCRHRPTLGIRKLIQCIPPLSHNPHCCCRAGRCGTTSSHPGSRKHLATALFQWMSLNQNVCPGRHFHQTCTADRRVRTRFRVTKFLKVLRQSMRLMRTPKITVVGIWSFSLHNMLALVNFKANKYTAMQFKRNAGLICD